MISKYSRRSESFSAAGHALGIPKSTVSRCVVRLETQLGTRLVQRTTHSVRLTEAGLALKERCTEILTRVNEAVDYVSSLSAVPKGPLKISAGIGSSTSPFARVICQTHGSSLRDWGRCIGTCVQRRRIWTVKARRKLLKI